MTPQTTQAKLVSLNALSQDIYEVILKPKDYIGYEAGQYLKIKIDNQWIPYSIANAPNQTNTYILHIKHTALSETTKKLFETLKQQDIELSLPYGHCCLSQFPSERPIIFIAGGTGFAPINAMIEALLAKKDAPSFELYWGVRQESDLYQKPKDSYTAYTSIATKEDPLLIDLILLNHPNDLNAYTIVLSGPFDMAYQLRDRLVSDGVNIKHLYSDAFDYEEK